MPTGVGVGVLVVCASIVGGCAVQDGGARDAATDARGDGGGQDGVAQDASGGDGKADGAGDAGAEAGSEPATDAGLDMPADLLRDEVVDALEAGVGADAATDASAGGDAPGDVAGDAAIETAVDVAGEAPAVYTFPGVATDLPLATVTAGGWTLCFSDLYSENGGDLSAILAACPKARLMLACRVVAATTLTAAAHADRADVLFDEGTGDATHAANGVEWYYNDNWSWGFAPGGEIVDRMDGCDTKSASANTQRLCWTTGTAQLTAGYRCGVTQSLYSTAGMGTERMIFQAD